MKGLQYVLILLLLINLWGCSELEDFNNAEEAYYMPDIDLFVVRSSTGDEQFVAQGESPDTFILRSFVGTGPESVNYYLTQVNVSFYHSRIRLFYIQMAPADVDLSTFSNSSQFTLTDEIGSSNEGTVFNEDGPLKIFFAGDTLTGASYAGIAYVNGIGVLILSKSTGYSSNLIFSRLIAHELGHNFSLWHPFGNDGLPTEFSCEPAAQGSTNRVMDYSSSPEIFVVCERLIASIWAKGNFYRMMAYDPDEGPWITTYTGSRSGQMIIGTPDRFTPKRNMIIEVD